MPDHLNMPISFVVRSSNGRAAMSFLKSKSGLIVSLSRSKGVSSGRAGMGSPIG